MDMPKSIVFVHGIAQAGRSSKDLAEEWLPALVKGTKGAFNPGSFDHVEFPFYGDILASYAYAPIGDGPIGELTRGTAQSTPMDEIAKVELDVAQDLINQALELGILSTDKLASLNPPADVLERGITDSVAVHALVGILSAIPGFQQAALHAFLREPSAYISNLLARRKIKRVVAETIRPNSIVVGHSLGSVVAYEVLRELTWPDGEVPLLVTLGSPLGVKTIRNALEPTSWPSQVKAWFNARDARDIVSMFGLGPDAFRLDRGEIENPPPVLNNGTDSHSITGYLEVPIVAKRIMKGISELK
jgi:hypothetical protein